MCSVTCTNGRFNNKSEENIMTTKTPKKTIEEVLKEHTGELMSLPGAVGTAQGLCDGRPCIKVYVTQNTPELEKRIPDILEGYQVVIEETGGFKALPQDQD